MTEISQRISIGFESFSRTIDALMEMQAVPLGIANPPEQSGVYLLLIGDEVVYVGEAKGSAGLKDRLLRKHLAGDESHAIQRAFAVEFPDRVLRREHIRNVVRAKWVVIPDPDIVSIVERIVIWLVQPSWNRK